MTRVCDSPDDTWNALLTRRTAGAFTRLVLADLVALWIVMTLSVRSAQVTVRAIVLAVAITLITFRLLSVGGADPQEPSDATATPLPF